MFLADFLSTDQIKTRYKYMPTQNTASKSSQIISKSPGPFMHVFKDDKGNYLLWKGINFYNTLNVINNKHTVLCQIHERPIDLYNWTINLFQSSYMENAYWKVKYELITILLNDCKKQAEEISKDSGVGQKEIEKYIINPAVPDYIKEFAIEKGNQPLINKICSSLISEDCKLLLYEMVFDDIKPLTHDKLVLFKKYISNHYFNPLAKNARAKIKDIVDKDAAFKYYWSSLALERRYVYKKSREGKNWTVYSL